MQFPSTPLIITLLAPLVAAEFIPYPAGTAPCTSEPTLFLQAALETTTAESSTESPLTTDLATTTTDLLSSTTDLDISPLTTTDLTTTTSLLPETTPSPPSNMTILEMLLTNQTTQVKYPNTTLAFLHAANQTTTTSLPLFANTTARLTNNTSILFANLSTTTTTTSLPLPTLTPTTLATETFQQVASESSVAEPAKTPSQPSATEQVFAPQMSTYVSGGQQEGRRGGFGGMVLGALFGAAVLGL